MKTTLKDFKLGDRVRMYVNSDGSITAHDYSHGTTEVTIIGRDIGNGVILGWKMTTSVLLAYAVIVGETSGKFPSFLLVPDFDDFKSYRHVGDHCEAELISQGSQSTQASQAKLSDFNNQKAVNDFTCPHCKNNRCSKSEKSCWLCGGKL